MTEPSSYPAVDALVAKARAAMNADSQTAPAAVDVPVGGSTTGSAADGLVTAEMGPDKRVRSLAIDPVMFKQPLADIAAAARTAINAAVDAGAADLDYSPVVEMIRDMQSQVRSGLGGVSDALAEVGQQVRAARGGNL